MKVDVGELAEEVEPKHAVGADLGDTTAEAH